jgi:hypothetical protein
MSSFNICWVKIISHVKILFQKEIVNIFWQD